MQVIGIIRFAYQVKGGFKLKPIAETDDIADVFDPERLRQRFATLVNVTLPGLRGQTDQDFKVVILTSWNLPEFYVEQLEKIVSTQPNLSLVLLPPLKQDEAVTIAIDSLREPDHEHVAHFRLDDDDAVAIDFIEQTKSIYGKIKNLISKRLGLDFSHGYLLNTTHQGLYIKTVHKRNWTPAQVVFLKADNHRHIISFPHNRLDRMMANITIPAPLMFVRTANDHNASGDFNHIEPAGIPRGFSELTETDVRILKDRFCISTSALQQALAK